MIGGGLAVARLHPEDERVARLQVQALQVECGRTLPCARALALDAARAYFAIRELRRIALAAALDVLERDTCQPQIIVRGPTHNDRGARHGAQQLVARGLSD